MGALGFLGGVAHAAGQAQQAQGDPIERALRLYQLRQQIQEDPLRMALLKQQVETGQAAAQEHQQLFPLELREAKQKAELGQYGIENARMINQVAQTIKDPLQRVAFEKDPLKYLQTTQGRQSMLDYAAAAFNAEIDPDRKRRLGPLIQLIATSADPTEGFKEFMKVAGADPGKPTYFQKDVMSPDLGAATVTMEVPRTGPARPVPMGPIPGTVSEEIPGGGRLFRKPSAAMDKSIDSVAQARQSLGDLNAWLKQQDPTGRYLKEGKLAPFSSSVQYQLYRMGYPTQRAYLFSMSSAIFQQLSSAAASGGVGRSKWAIKMLNEHYPHPWDTSENLLNKIKVLQQVADTMQRELVYGPGSMPPLDGGAGGGETATSAPTGGGASAPTGGGASASAASASAPAELPPDVPKPPFAYTDPKPGRFNYVKNRTDGRWWVFNPSTKHWQPMPAK